MADGVFTLAICKPAIRRKANARDWILGITPKGLGWRLAYAVMVRSKIRGEDYYSIRRPRRQDQIYRFKNGQFELRNTDIHDKSDGRRDIGSAPGYKNAWILKGSRTKTWYWGRKAKPLSELGRFPNLQRKVEDLSQGHRVNHSKRVRVELEELLREVSKRQPGIYGKPRDPPKPCNHDEFASNQHGVC